MKHRVKIRRFLNRSLDAGSRSLAIGYVEDTSDKQIGKKSNQLSYVFENTPLTELVFGDCSRQVSFEFDLSTAKARANSLAKIEALLDVVSAVHDALHDEALLAERREPLVRQFEKAREKTRAKGRNS